MYPLHEGPGVPLALEDALLQLLPVVEAGPAPHKAIELQRRGASSQQRAVSRVAKGHHRKLHKSCAHPFAYCNKGVNVC